MPHYYIMDKDSHLAHYGRTGQQWGVRNYQNYDGTYTQAGLERYWPNSKHGTRGGFIDDAKFVAKYVWDDMRMSPAERRERDQRRELIRRAMQRLQQEGPRTDEKEIAGAKFKITHGFSTIDKSEYQDATTTVTPKGLDHDVWIEAHARAKDSYTIDDAASQAMRIVNSNDFSKLEKQLAKILNDNERDMIEQFAEWNGTEPTPVKNVGIESMYLNHKGPHGWAGSMGLDISELDEEGIFIPSVGFLVDDKGKVQLDPHIAWDD